MPFKWKTAILGLNLLNIVLSCWNGQMIVILAPNLHLSVTSHINCIVNGIAWKNHRKLIGANHREDYWNKAISSLFLIKMIAKLERHLYMYIHLNDKYCITKQRLNTEHWQTIGVTINRGSYISVHVLLNLLNDLRKSDKMRAFYRFLATSLINVRFFQSYNI